MPAWPVHGPAHALAHTNLSCSSFVSTDLHLGTIQYLFTALKMLPLSSALTFGIRDLLSSCVILCICSIIQKRKLKKLSC